MRKNQSFGLRFCLARGIKMDGRADIRIKI
jgi:hypothetical protein